MKIQQYMTDHLLYLDGGMGTLLQAAGMQPGELPERRNLTHPQDIVAIHRAYFDAGSNLVCTNTFGANALKYQDDELRQIIHTAVQLARRAAQESVAQQPKYVALDIGPLGRLLKPYGDLDFEQAVAIFAKTVRFGVECGADVIMIETMSDSYETKAALLAAKENSTLPVFVSNAYGEDGKLMTGASPAAMVAMLEGMRADAIGVNCSLGPEQLKTVVKEYLECASVPVLVKPNAGLPRNAEGKTVYDVTPDDFADVMAAFVREGVRVVGGCCGTSPDYIAALVAKTKTISPVRVTDKNKTVVSSYTHAVEFFSRPILIGERINPTGKRRLKEALLNRDMDYILNEGFEQQNRGAHILDINVGLPEIDEVSMLRETVQQVQAVIDLPLQIDTADPNAMEAALRAYNGKAMINSVNGKESVMRKVFPLVQKYGGLVVCLTLDDDGIPETSEGRVKIAEKIISVASEYGIERKNLIFDTLAMAISADTSAAQTTLRALHEIKTRLHCHTLLGVSNISFGLPERETMTSVFFALALENGLSAAIMNPGATSVMRSYYSFCALHGLDASCADYIENIVSLAAQVKDLPQQTTTLSSQGQESGKSELQRAIVKGLRQLSGALTEKMITGSVPPLQIVNDEIIPALDIVGRGFEEKTVYLPQLLMSAEAASAAFECIKVAMKGQGEAPCRGKFVLATVHGDIHDIGKNIVKLLLENYGFDVLDLGKDVPPARVVEMTIQSGASLVGLSALMTTTVPAMEATIAALREAAPHVKIVVGGAVLTEEYAASIGADYYAKDAMATVRYALEICM